MSVVAFTAGSLGDIITICGIIAKVIKSFNDGPSLSDTERRFLLNLHSLDAAIQAARIQLQLFDTIAGRNSEVPALIHQELLQCSFHLQRFLQTIETNRACLKYTSIASLARCVLWTTQGPGEVQQMMDVVERHKSQITVLYSMLSSSYSVQILAHLRKPHSNQSRIENMRLASIIICDPVGKEFLVAIDYLNTWDDMHEIILAHTKNRCGYQHIRRHAYDLLDKDDKIVKAIKPSIDVDDGARWEMSMIEVQRDIKEWKMMDCPKCGHPNGSARQAAGSWTTCTRCSGRFCNSENSELDAENEIVSPEVRPKTNTATDFMLFRRIRRVFLSPAGLSAGYYQDDFEKDAAMAYQESFAASRAASGGGYMSRNTAFSQTAGGSPGGFGAGAGLAPPFLGFPMARPIPETEDSQNGMTRESNVTNSGAFPGRTSPGFEPFNGRLQQPIPGFASGIPTRWGISGRSTSLDFQPIIGHLPQPIPSFAGGMPIPDAQDGQSGASV